MIIGIPTNDGVSVSDVFGRCAKLAIGDTATGQVQLIDNTANAQLAGGAGMNTGLAFLEQHVDKIVTVDFGPKAKDVFKDKNVEIIMIDAVKKIAEIMEEYKN